MKPDPIVSTAAPRQIPVACPSLGHAEAQAAFDCVMGGRISQGPLVEQFEREFAAAHGKAHGCCVSNGTNALMLALVAAGVKEGSRVIVPVMQMVALGNVVVHLGAIPVFVDSEPETGNPDPQALERCAVTHRADAIIASGLYGVPPAAFIDACRQHAPHVPVIEDMCECHFAAYPDGTPAGSKGRFACWSFFGNKILAAGEGGLVATSDAAAAERMRSLRSHAFSPDCHFQHTELAYACRFSDLQASVALAQHHRRAEMLAARERIYQRYRDALGGIDGLTLQPDVPGAARWVYPLLCRNEAARDNLRFDLAQAGIESRSFFWPLHLQPHLQQYATDQYPVAERLGRTGLYLPLFATMTDDDVSYICQTVRGSLL